eukprot:scaffold92321_cov63-Phaeocystis_antarctica.AAC.1
MPPLRPVPLWEPSTEARDSVVPLVSRDQRHSMPVPLAPGSAMSAVSLPSPTAQPDEGAACRRSAVRRSSARLPPGAAEGSLASIAM